MSKLACTLSLDLDDAWTYMRAAGRPGWETTPSVIPLVCPRILEMCDEFGVRLTLFVVAHDLDDPHKVAAIRPFVARGHEIGCHSWHHEPTFATLSREQMREEVLVAAAKIEQQLGVRPVGFRAPGFAWNALLPGVLREGGFHYDCSPLPTWLGPLCRLYYFFNSGMSREDRKKRGAMYGGVADAFRSLAPRLLPGQPELWQLPVTTIPILRAPFHMSYVIWLSRYAKTLATLYLGSALAACRLFRTEPSYLLHSLDFVGSDEHPLLGFFPGMAVPWAGKQTLLQDMMRRLRAGFAVMPLGQRLPRAAAARPSASAVP